jgi:lysozyme
MRNVADPEASAVQSSLLDAFSGVGDVNAIDANVAAFLAMIRASEGTAGPDGYRTIFGGRLFDNNFVDHPRVRVPFTQTDGVQNFSTAAGAYQFTVRTWDDLAAKLGLPDFSPPNQDAGAMELIRERNALDDVKAGRFDDAVNKIATVWASLPGSPYPQRTRSRDFVRIAYEQNGGGYG